MAFTWTFGPLVFSGRVSPALRRVRHAVAVCPDVVERARIAGAGHRTCAFSRHGRAGARRPACCACRRSAATTHADPVRLRSVRRSGEHLFSAGPQLGTSALRLLHSAMLAPILDALAATAAKASRSGVGRRFDYGGLRAAVSAAYAPGALVSGWQAGAAELALLLPNLPLARSPAARPIRRRMPRCIAPPTMRMNKRAAPLFAPRPLPRSVPWCGGRR